jgi:hypothetical protein
MAETSGRGKAVGRRVKNNGAEFGASGTKITRYSIMESRGWTNT